MKGFVILLSIVLLAFFTYNMDIDTRDYFMSRNYVLNDLEGLLYKGI